MTRSPRSGSARQLARKQGLARISAVTLGVGAASVTGAVAIAVTMAHPTTPNPQTIASASPSDDTAAQNDTAVSQDVPKTRTSRSGDDDDQGARLPRSVAQPPRTQPPRTQPPRTQPPRTQPQQLRATRTQPPRTQPQQLRATRPPTRTKKRPAATSGGS